MNKQPFFVLAPMDDVTDTVFRSIVAHCAPPDMTMTEFVNVDGLRSAGREALLHKLDTRFDTIPVIAQLWGKKPENFASIAEELANSGKFAGIDINFGCPDKTVVKNGCCSAYILPENRQRALEVIRATKAAVGDFPLSIKTRLGFNEIDYSWHELLLAEKPDMLTVHFRTRSEMSKVPAHWDLAPKIIEIRNRLSPNTKIVGNGDVVDVNQGVLLAEQYGVDGVMIGRGVFHNPFAFSADAEKIWTAKNIEEKKALFRSHIEKFDAVWVHGERKLHTLFKFCKIYINGFDGASQLREKIMTSKSTKEVLDILSN